MRRVQAPSRDGVDLPINHLGAGGGVGAAPPFRGIDGSVASADTPRVGVPVYRGPFGNEQAERLLWRAGFGPRPGEAEALARLGLQGAVHELTNPGLEKLIGPKPHDEKGRPLAP